MHIYVFDSYHVCTIFTLLKNVLLRLVDSIDAFYVASGCFGKMLLFPDLRSLIQLGFVGLSCGYGR